MGSSTLRAREVYTSMTVDSTTQDSSAASAQTLTLAAASNKRYYVKAFEVVISGNTAAADITAVLKSGTTSKWKTIIGQGAARGERVGMVFGDDAIQCGLGEAVTVEVSSGGTGVITSVSIAYALSS